MLLSGDFGATLRRLDLSHNVLAALSPSIAALAALEVPITEYNPLVSNLHTAYRLTCTPSSVPSSPIALLPSPPRRFRTSRSRTPPP